MHPKSNDEFYSWSNRKLFCFLLFSSAKLICPWGIEGAIAVDNETDSHFSAFAKPPAKVVDSLGAGDTFVASAIHSLAQGIPLQEAIDYGCRIAGAKVGFYGYDNISSLI